MARNGAGADADGVTFSTTSKPSKTESAMQPFSPSQQPWSNSTLPQDVPQRARATAARKRDCGWFDSSFDLAEGLEVTEQDSDTLYQLWELSRR